MAVDVTQLRRSPLGHRYRELEELSALAPQATLAEEPPCTQLNLRVRPGSPPLDRVERALGVALPSRPNTVCESVDGRYATLWLGPDEWLVVAPDGTAEPVCNALNTALNTALDGGPGSVVDVSANRAVLRLSGPAARDVLETGCSVDLHPRAFGPGDCVQTMLARAQVVLWQRDDLPAYWILVRSSFADYLTDWLCAAVRAQTRGR
ncbi:MAG: sarcosine oxidase subunit gamma [Pseudonocardiaceae bacterium]|nr:sarcosine oxidase subunit gamma [Pseudonocardiaceae bacterium]